MRAISCSRVPVEIPDVEVESGRNRDPRNPQDCPGGDGGAGGGDGEQQYEVVDPSGAPLESQLHMSLRHTAGLEPQYVPGSSLAVQSRA